MTEELYINEYPDYRPSKDDPFTIEYQPRQITAQEILRDSEKSDGHIKDPTLKYRDEIGKVVLQFGVKPNSGGGEAGFLLADKTRIDDFLSDAGYSRTDLSGLNGRQVNRYMQSIRLMAISLK